MHFLSFSLILSAAALANAATAGPDNNHEWIAPTATDVRSPCPGLNTLANHGYIPRNGKNISIPVILAGALEAFNMGPDGLTQAAKFGLLSGDAPDTLDLDALKLHNLIEHDASISRGDLAVTGDNLHFNETIFTTLANANPDVDYYDPLSAGQVQFERLAISLATNPNITNTLKEISVRTRESSFYLSVMGNPITGVAQKEFVQIFFREERLPIAEGWKRANVTITADTLNTIGDIIIAASNWTATQQCEDLVLGPTLTI
ncbi:Chloroperoxidase [Mycena maculata]|uniref:Chloroperoxidase n=1 Tax=Mycena maculata TaxID=230809 RepID=A0AAD7J7G2_9AGAR|nr:Chloroperoxidase [Mycena maculata]